MLEVPFLQRNGLSLPLAGPPVSSQQPLWIPCQRSSVSERTQYSRLLQLNTQPKDSIKQCCITFHQLHTSETSSKIRPKVEALSVRSSLTCLDTSSLWVMSSLASNLAWERETLSAFWLCSLYIQPICLAFNGLLLTTTAFKTSVVIDGSTLSS